MEENRVIRKDAILKIKKNMEYLRTQKKTISREIKKSVEESTFQEKADLERAMERYYNKLNKVLASKTIQDKILKGEECEDKMHDLMYKVKVSYRKAIREILKQPVSKEEKEKKITQLKDVIEDAILTSDEKKLLQTIKSQIKNLPYQNYKLIC